MSKLNVVCGTSIEDATGANSWVERMAKRLPADRIVLDRSLGGGCYTVPFADGDSISKHVQDAITEFASATDKTMILGAPMNDLMRLTTAEITTKLTQKVFDLTNLLRQSSWRVICMATWPITSGGPFPESYYPALTERRLAYNNWAAAYFGSDYVDLSWYLRETRDWYRADYRFFSDGLHPNSVGALIIGETFPIELLL
jgi:lysophospholipase L1-like esterase